MLTDLCAELKNYFEVPNGRHFGTFTVSGGVLAPLDFLNHGQYFRIVGSLFNDGVWQYPAVGLTDETFDGAVWAMAVPRAVVELSNDIDAIKEQIDRIAQKETGFTSESYPNGYSYSKPSSLPYSIQHEIGRLNIRKAVWRKL